MTSSTFDQKKWSLTDLFVSHDSPDMQVAFSNLEASVTDFETRRASLSENIPETDFLDIIRQFEKINHLARRVQSFASLNFAGNTQDQLAQTFVARVDQFMADLENRTMFFNLWWKSLEDAPAERLMAQAGDYRYWLEEMRHFKPHTLTEAEEKVINIKDVTGSRALVTLYDSITNRYSFKVSVKGEVKDLTRGELMVFVRDPDPNLRASAYQELYRFLVRMVPSWGKFTRPWQGIGATSR